MGDGTESPSVNIDFPAGFNKDNSIILTVNLKRVANGIKGYGTTFDSSSFVGGSVPSKVTMNEDDILLEIKAVLLSETPSITMPEMSTSLSFDYTIVLMKIGD